MRKILKNNKNKILKSKKMKMTMIISKNLKSKKAQTILKIMNKILMRRLILIQSNKMKMHSFDAKPKPRPITSWGRGPNAMGQQPVSQE